MFNMDEKILLNELLELEKEEVLKLISLSDIFDKLDLESHLKMVNNIQNKINSI